MAGNVQVVADELDVSAMIFGLGGHEVGVGRWPMKGSLTEPHPASPLDGRSGRTPIAPPLAVRGGPFVAVVPTWPCPLAAQPLRAEAAVSIGSHEAPVKRI